MKQPQEITKLWGLMKNKRNFVYSELARGIRYYYGKGVIEKVNDINFYEAFFIAPLLFHYIFTISQLWLTFYPRSTEVLLDTGTPGTSGEIYSEDADDGIRTRNPSVVNRVL